ncbi:MAG TPA: hypothetical protein VF268_13970 [Gammaproteobacteria bacterium]
MIQLEMTDIIAAIATIIAFGSLLLAGRSYQISRRALQLTEADFNEKRLPIKPYLIDGFVFREEDKKYAAFAISYTNQSSSHATFYSLELEVEFYDEEGIYGKAISAPDFKVIPLGINDNYKKLEIPLNLLPKTTVSGWVTFALPFNLNRRYRTDSYKVRAEGPEGRDCFVEACLLRRVTSEEKNKAK